MALYLFDTNHASLLYRKNPLIYARFSTLPSTDRVFLCAPSVGELWFMVYNSARVDENVLLMEQFLSAFQHLLLDAQAAREFGRIKSDARRRGRQLAGVDAQIAAIARTKDLTLLTDDQDFQGVSGLRIENWIR